MKNALAGNRTPVSRVAGENSTTEPPMLDINDEKEITYSKGSRFVLVKELHISEECI